MKKTTREYSVKRVLNVGGGPRDIPLPPIYDGWKRFHLDIDLEHYYRHDVFSVLTGFRHVLRPDGFVFLRVPDIGALMRLVVEKNMDIEDVVYDSLSGPITVRDVLYGLGTEIARRGEDFYAHKTGFTTQSLIALLRTCGFEYVCTATLNLEIWAYAFPQPPTAAAALLKLTPILSAP